MTLYFTKTLHISLSSAGVIMSCYGIGTFSGSLVSGKLTDRFSAQTISVFYLLMKTIALLILLESTRVFMLCLCVFLLGVSDYGFYISSAAALLTHYHNDSIRKLKIMALLATASNAGMGVSIFLAGFFIQSDAKWLLTIIALLTFLSAMVLNAYPFQQKITDVNDEVENTVKKNSRLGLRVLALITVAMVGIMFAQIKTVGVLYLHQAFPAVSLHNISLILLLNLLLVVFLQTPITTVFKKYAQIDMIQWGL